MRPAILWLAEVAPRAMDLDRLRRAVRSKRFEWRKHALVRIAERNLHQSDVLEVLSRGEVIEEYSGVRPLPCVLLFGTARGKPLHVVAAYDQAVDWAYVITAYEPSLEEFDADFRTRRRKP